MEAEAGKAKDPDQCGQNVIPELIKSTSKSSADQHKAWLEKCFTKDAFNYDYTKC